eukprot:UC4_evm4s494
MSSSPSSSSLGDAFTPEPSLERSEAEKMFSQMLDLAFPKSKPPPDSISTTKDAEIAKLKARIVELEAKLASQNTASVMNIPSSTEARRNEHMPKSQRKKFHPQSQRVEIFWDLENVNIPASREPMAAHRTYTKLLELLAKEKILNPNLSTRRSRRVRCYYRPRFPSASWASLEQLQDAGVILVNVLDKGKKEACDRAIERDIRMLCEEALNPESQVDPLVSTVVMISSDFDFAPVMAAAKARGFRTVVCKSDSMKGERISMYRRLAHVKIIDCTIVFRAVAEDDSLLKILRHSIDSARQTPSYYKEIGAYMRHAHNGLVSYSVLKRSLESFLRGEIVQSEPGADQNMDHISLSRSLSTSPEVKVFDTSTLNWIEAESWQDKTRHILRLRLLGFFVFDNTHIDGFITNTELRACVANGFLTELQHTEITAVIKNANKIKNSDEYIIKDKLLKRYLHQACEFGILDMIKIDNCHLKSPEEYSPVEFFCACTTCNSAADLKTTVIKADDLAPNLSLSMSPGCVFDEDPFGIST